MFREFSHSPEGPSDGPFSTEVVAVTCKTTSGNVVTAKDCLYPSKASLADVSNGLTHPGGSNSVSGQTHRTKSVLNVEKTSDFHRVVPRSPFHEAFSRPLFGCSSVSRFAGRRRFRRSETSLRQRINPPLTWRGQFRLLGENPGLLGDSSGFWGRIPGFWVRVPGFWVRSRGVCGSVRRRLLPADHRRLKPLTGATRNFSKSHWTAAGSRMSKKLLVDVDCGVDDAQAIMLALAAPNVKLLGITCVQGNTTVENVCRNTLRVLQACDRLEIPVYKGAAKPILGNVIDAGNFHGHDGLGDAPDPEAPGLDLVQEEDAVSAIIRIVTENPGEVSLVAMAPLTNLALAVRMDPSLPSKLRGLYIMGGNTESRGNTTVCGEFNFTADPEAAYIVLNDYLCPTHLACWEFTCCSKLSWEFCDAWLAQDSKKARFMARIFRHSMETSKSERSEKEFVAGSGFVSCDSYAMAAAVDDSLITESDHHPVSVELTGTLTRGMMVVDTVGFLKKSHKAFIMKKVDMKKFEQMMMAALK